MDSVDLNSREAHEIAVSVLYLHEHFWRVSVLSLAAVAIHSLLTTHRLAGPLYRFRQVIKSVTEGTLPGPGRLRRRDFFQPEMNMTNEMLESLRRRVSEIQEAQVLLAESVSDCKRRVESLADAEMTRCVADLAAKADQNARSVFSFRVAE
jgi:methyl-accepting chemotaxis protein